MRETKSFERKKKTNTRPTRKNCKYTKYNFDKNRNLKNSKSLN